MAGLPDLAGAADPSRIDERPGHSKGGADSFGKLLKPCHLFPLSNPGIVSIPVSFLCGYLGTVLNRGDRADPDRQAEMEVRSLTGIGT